MKGGSENIGGFVSDLGEAARRNPISAALIGMGAVWLFASRSQRGAELIRRSGIVPDAARDALEGTSSNIRSGVRNLEEMATDTADRLRRQGNSAMDGMTEAGQRLLQSASDYAGDLPDRAGNLFDDAKDSLSDLFRSQPLAIGVAGIAIGAAIAAAFPTTETEAEYLGESSELLRQKASEIAGEQVERAAEIGTKVADAVVEEARKQGLTTGALKSVASQLSDKASRVAKAGTSGSKS
jgi:hypothetical protein